MKLIQILGLIAALGVGAAAQTTGAPDPAKSTKKSTDQKTTGNPAPGTTSTAKPAAGTAQTTPAAGKAKTTTGKIQINTVKTPPKKTVKTDVKTVPADGAKKTVTTETVTTKQKTVTTKTEPKKPVAADTKKTDTKKTEAKKTDTKKTDAKKADTKKKPAPVVTTDKKKAKPAEKKPVIAAKPGTTAPAPPRTSRASAAGRRDPFVSPIRATPGGPEGPKNCSTGKRCLYIPEVVVQGTVRDLSGKMVAVVVNRARHTYFVREGDQVFNGSVQRITTDSVTFREYVTDNIGRESVREVVKRVGVGGTS